MSATESPSEPDEDDVNDAQATIESVIAPTKEDDDPMAMLIPADDEIIVWDIDDADEIAALEQTSAGSWYPRYTPVAIETVAQMYASMDDPDHECIPIDELPDGVHQDYQED